jgi:hypothetical protein
LIRNIWWNILLERYGYLKLKHVFLPMAYFYTDVSLFEGSGVFLEELDFKAFFALGTFALIFQDEVYTILACSDYCLRECLSGKTICICSDSRFALLALSLHTLSSRLVL